MTGYRVQGVWARRRSTFMPETNVTYKLLLMWDQDGAAFVARVFPEEYPTREEAQAGADRRNEGHLPAQNIIRPEWHEVGEVKS